jgi:transposase
MKRAGTSLQLEEAYHRNIDALWLLESLASKHNTISVIRNDNAKAINRLFFAAAELAINFGLNGTLLIAGQRTKLKAKNNE